MSGAGGISPPKGAGARFHGASPRLMLSPALAALGAITESEAAAPGAGIPLCNLGRGLPTGLGAEAMPRAALAASSWNLTSCKAD